ncbi:MAG TPA: prepilin-type N-terminal cleavage/methylation domain-containing protein [Candidatus Saccharimonadales bacterium]|nr:prepilin-type N-terminal cleavage/methylation domain-containing protein [Candidatus Saccharimonadales bacterium]
MFRLRNRGDTIVEVMIVLAVLGLAISISYATADRSLLNARQAQENSIATELAQSQVEGLSSLGCASADPTCDPTNPVNPSYQLFHQANPFCLNSSNSIVSYPNPTTVPAACKIDSLYEIKITYHQSATQPSTFEVLITWPDVLEGTDTVRQDYVIPQDIAPQPTPPPDEDGGGGGGGGGSQTCDSGYTGTYPDCVPAIPLSISVNSKSCGTTFAGFFSPLYTADLTITGSPGDTVNLKDTVHYDPILEAFSSFWSPVTQDDGAVTLGADGKATKSVTSSIYFLYSWTVTAADANGNNTSVQVCP